MNKKADVKAALEDLKRAMFSPDPKLKNPYQHYTYAQLEELTEEIEGELDRLPPFAVGKLKVLTEEAQQLSDAVNIKLERGDTI